MSNEIHIDGSNTGAEVVGDCMFEQLRRLSDDPDNMDLMTCVVPGHEGMYDADDVSTTEHFTCQKTGCMGRIAVVQWFDEPSETSGSYVYMLSGNCHLGH